MSSPVPIADRDFWVPSFEVRLGGRRLPGSVLRDVLSVSYSDSLDKLDSFEMTLSNWDEEARDFKYSGRTRSEPPVDFRPGLELELWMGYRDAAGLSRMLRGEVVSLAPDFPDGGQPTLQIRALNKLYKLHFKQSAAVFENETDTEIATKVIASMSQELAQRASSSGSPPLDLQLVGSDLNATIEERHRYIAMNNEYPIVFLMERARHNGYDLFIEEQEGTTLLHFHPPERSVPPAYELIWGGSLTSFKPTLKTKEQVSKVTVRGWNPQEKEAFDASATWADLDNPGLLDAAEMSGADSALAGAEIVIADEPVFSEQEARQKAKDKLTSLTNDLVTGTGATIGLPELRAGRPVFIRKLGAPFSGRYLVTSTTHAIGDSYTTRFEARMEQPDPAGGGS